MRASALGRAAAVRTEVAVTTPPVAVPLTQCMACNAASFFRHSVPSLRRRRPLNRRFALAASSGDIWTHVRLKLSSKEMGASIRGLSISNKTLRSRLRVPPVSERLAQLVASLRNARVDNGSRLSDPRQIVWQVNKVDKPKRLANPPSLFPRPPITAAAERLHVVANAPMTPR